MDTSEIVDSDRQTDNHPDQQTTGSDPPARAWSDPTFPFLFFLFVCFDGSKVTIYLSLFLSLSLQPKQASKQERKNTTPCWLERVTQNKEDEDEDEEDDEDDQDNVNDGKYIR